MDKKYQKIWKLALPYLKKGVRKDFVVHTKGVVKAMEMILEEEKGDRGILIISAILHDAGWSMVSEKLQLGWRDKKIKLESEKQHIRFAPKVIREILRKAGFKENDIEKVIAIVQSHLFKNPRNKEKRLLIDADNLSDVFKKQFYTDADKYKVSPNEMLKCRMKNKFYTETAKIIFKIESDRRKREILNL